MAYFQQRSGNWRAIVKRNGHERITRTFDTKGEAEVWARSIECEMDRGIFVSRKEAESTTLSEALDRYEREVIPAKKGAVQESMRIRIWKRHPLAHRFIASIHGKDIAAYRDARLKEVAPNTVRHELAVLSHLFTIAIKEWGMAGLINPVQQIRAPKMPPGRDRRLLPGELEKIIESSESVHLPDIVRLAVETGMRQAEIAGMTWDLVDLKKRIVTLLKTKNGEKRIVPLPLEAVRILSELPRRIDGQVWGIQPRTVAIAFARALSKARSFYEKECERKKEKPDPSFLVNLHFHDLRHEATSRFFELGLDATKVKEITGHKTYSMLARYTHLKAEDIAAEIDKLKRLRTEDLAKRMDG
ncbi:MAG: site-specific integrase [Leptospirales bacterium]